MTTDQSRELAENLKNGAGIISQPSNYRIILDESILDTFIADLPELASDEVWYFCLFGRHKYDPSFPNTKDSGQLARMTASSKRELKEKIRRLETPYGSYSRFDTIATQQCLATYIAVNPRSLVKANKAILIELATKFATGETTFNPVSIANTEIHRAVDRKLFVDFDYDGNDLNINAYRAWFNTLVPEDSYRILKTVGGFHLLVELEKVRDIENKQWFKDLSDLPYCDVRGSDCLTPIPGCTQDGFCPHFV